MREPGGAQFAGKVQNQAADLSRPKGYSMPNDIMWKRKKKQQNLEELAGEQPLLR